MRCGKALLRVHVRVRRDPGNTKMRRTARSRNCYTIYSGSDNIYIIIYELHHPRQPNEGCRYRHPSSGRMPHIHNLNTTAVQLASNLRYQIMKYHLTCLQDCRAITCTPHNKSHSTTRSTQSKSKLPGIYGHSKRRRKYKGYNCIPHPR